MMYQPYPKAGAQEAPPERPQAPRSVLNAVKLMYAGAGLSAIEVIISLALIGGVHNAIRKARPHLSAVKIHDLVVADVVGTVFIGLVGVALWIVMARTNAAGRNWARIVASVLFGVNTIGLLLGLRRLSTGLGIGVVLDVVGWLIGLGAIIFLWRKESSTYFQQG
jgi:hypothetical protein